MSWQATIERTVQGLGYEMVDAERTAGGLLRVTIDRVANQSYASGAGEHVTVEDCELCTRQLQYVLEVEGLDYARLEVSSPGLDRPLRKPSDWERFTGCDVEITLRAPFQGRRKWSGLLVGRDGGYRLVLPAPEVSKTKAKKALKAEKDGPAVKAEAAAEQGLDFSLDEVREARLVPVVDFKGRRRVQDDATKQDGGQNR